MEPSNQKQSVEAASVESSQESVNTTNVRIDVSPIADTIPSNNTPVDYTQPIIQNYSSEDVVANSNTNPLVAEISQQSPNPSLITPSDSFTRNERISNRIPLFLALAVLLIFTSFFSLASLTMVMRTLTTITSPSVYLLEIVWLLIYLTCGFVFLFSRSKKTVQLLMLILLGAQTLHILTQGYVTFKLTYLFSTGFLQIIGLTIFTFFIHRKVSKLEN